MAQSTSKTTEKTKNKFKKCEKIKTIIEQSKLIIKE